MPKQTPDLRPRIINQVSEGTAKKFEDSNDNAKTAFIGIFADIEAKTVPLSLSPARNMTYEKIGADTEPSIFSFDFSLPTLAK